MSRTPPNPEASSIICTVDVVLLTLIDRRLKVLLHRRPAEPHAGAWALPGGFIHPQDDATAWHAAERVLRHKTGLVSPYLEQLATYSGAERDPRGWSVSIVYFALVDADASALTLGDALRWVPVDRVPRLPFDHADIIELAVQRVRSKSLYSSLPVYLCGDTFTLPQLQGVYEAVLGEPINKVSFRRKVDELGVLEPVDGAMTGGAHRPAQLYRLKAPFRRQLSMLHRGLKS